MIYNSNYKKEELTKGVLITSNNKWKLLIHSLIVALLSCALVFVFQSVNETIAESVFVKLSNNNAFSVISICEIVITFFIMIYMFSNYNDMTFSDIKTNRAYLLQKMGVKKSEIILMKFVSAIELVLSVYLVSFVFSIILCAILGFPLNVNVLFNLFIIGSIKLIAVVVTILLLSCFFKHIQFSILIFIGLLILDCVLQYLTGYYKIVSYVSKIANLGDTFNITSSFYMSFVLFYVVCAVVFISLYSSKKMNYYYTRRNMMDGVVAKNWRNDAPLKLKKDRQKMAKRIYNVNLGTLLGLLFSFGFATNIYLIFMGKSTLSNTTTIGKKVSILFDSTTMTGDIYKNDLATFKVVTSDETISIGDVIYYLENGNAVVEKVTNIVDNDYYIDINYYPVSAETGSLATTISRNKIVGKLVGTNRAAGAWIVFNQTIAGKIIMLGIPVVIVLFYDKLRKLAYAYMRLDDVPLDKKVESK